MIIAIQIDGPQSLRSTKQNPWCICISLWMAVNACGSGIMVLYPLHKKPLAFCILAVVFI